MIVEAGQYGHCNHFGMQACSSFGILHHRTASGGMDGHNGGLKHVDRLHGLCDGIGNIVQFQVEENGQAQLLNFMHAVMPVRAKKF